MRKNNAIAKIIMKICLLMMIWFADSVTINAQTNQSQNEPFDSPSGFISCEMWILYVSDAVQRWSKNEDSSLIVIARLDSKETSRRINPKRLKTLREYILYLNPKTKIILAEGERTKDSSIIEFYVKGKLLYSIPIRKKEDIPVRLCN